MTKTKFVIVDNHRLKKGCRYNIIYETESFKEYKEYVERKGLI